jgi:hypothetical protein
VLGDPFWLERAACRDANPDWFVISHNTQGQDALNALARAICRRCPVRADCEEWGTDRLRGLIYGGNCHPPAPRNRHAAPGPEGTTRTCAAPDCSQEFTPRMPQHRYHSRKCQNRVYPPQRTSRQAAA